MIRTRTILANKYREILTAYLFMLPFMVGMIVFYLYPIISAFTHSFTKWTGYTAAVFTGLQNYSTAIDDPLLRKELYNTIRYILLSLPLSIGVALVFAELLNSKIRGRGFYRVLFYLPNITMSVVVVLVWRMLLNTRFGLITMAVKAIFGNCPSFLADPEYVMYTMVMMSVWTSMGYNIIYLLSWTSVYTRNLF